MNQFAISFVSCLIVKKKYNVTDREALSLMLDVRNFHVYMRVHVAVFSELELLQYLAKLANNTS